MTSPLLPFVSLVLAASAPITLEDVAGYPRPGMAIPKKIAFAPSGRLVTFLASPDRSLVHQLYAFDRARGEVVGLSAAIAEADTEEGLSLEEKLRRERQRTRATGVTRYLWARDADVLVIPLAGGVWVRDAQGVMRQLVSGAAGPALDPQPSPDGSKVAFVRGGDVWVAAVADGAVQRVTASAGGRVSGLAEFVAQEEMDRDHGLWWSRDSRSLAFAEVDESHIPVYRIVHQGKGATGAAAQEDHRYPFAGAANARVRLGVVTLTTDGTFGEPKWLAPPLAEELYLARVSFHGPAALMVQYVNRTQSRLDLVRFDPRTGRGRHILEERSDVWINLHHDLAELEDGGFLWASERSGYRHLERRDPLGPKLATLTDGEWMVDALECVSADFAYFSATRAAVTERHLYQVALVAPPALRRITAAPGWHDVEFAADCRAFVDTHDALSSPPSVTVFTLEERELVAAREAVLHDPRRAADRDPRLDRLQLRPPRLVTLESRDGAQLHGAVYEPDPAVAKPPFRTMVSVYGGPHGQVVRNSWSLTADMRAQNLRQAGILVFKLDNRGSARRGLAFEGALRHDMGNIEVRDQADGVRWLVAKGLAAPDRVGIYGWSYGGYMAAIALARAPDVFRLAVAGAPVTHWDGYDTFYTERYMGTPQSNPAGYRDSSVMTHIRALRGPLLLVHGLLDENVHFRHTARLIDALIAARKEHELILFPNERHMPRRLEDRVYMEERVVRFIDGRL